MTQPTEGLLAPDAARLAAPARWVCGMRFSRRAPLAAMVIAAALLTGCGAGLSPVTIQASVTETGPQTINHYGQLPAATISFNLKPGAALGEGVDQVQALATQ